MTAASEDQTSVALPSGRPCAGQPWPRLCEGRESYGMGMSGQSWPRGTGSVGRGAQGQ